MVWLGADFNHRRLLQISAFYRIFGDFAAVVDAL